MFGDKKNINILTSLLIAHGVRKAVVCPGSRNAPILHSLNECDGMTCYPVTDERSAGFYALGMSLADDNPVALCVTSGTALLNLAPAVAEATYRHHGLVIISADRPSAWIGQLDGQTLHQPDAFGCLVCKSVNLPEPHDDVEYWHCNRLVNEALLAVRSAGRGSVHINVPISEPLFRFNVERLPVERVINKLSARLDVESFRQIVCGKLLSASRPMLIVGQLGKPSQAVEDALRRVSTSVAVLSEPLSDGTLRPFDLVLASLDEDESLRPDFLLYVGDTVVSKRLKNFIRKSACTEIWAVTEDGDVHDTFMHMSGVVEGDTMEALQVLAKELDARNEHGKSENAEACRFAELWNGRMEVVKRLINGYEPAYSQMAAVRMFERSLQNVGYRRHVHYANSNAVRLACIYSRHYVWCNRGVNGIEGSVSTAAGFSLATDDVVFCVTGDLSFFYDQNALWNVDLKGNLRIILLNNNCGGIFYSLQGLQDSGAFDRLVTARHDVTAQGICVQNGVYYHSARNLDELRDGLSVLMTADCARPILLEVFTDAEEDKRVMADFMKYIKE